MANWKDNKNKGPWPFVPQYNKWAYLNNPRWQPTPRPFEHGGPDDYNGRESEEPQQFTPYHQPPYPTGDSEKHHQCGHWHKTTPTTETGIPLLTPIEMVGAWLFDDDIDMLWTCTEVEIDPADYPGLTHTYFEVVADNSSWYRPGWHDAVTKTIKLMDASLHEYASIDIAPGNGVMERHRVEFTLNSAKTKYYVFFPASNFNEMLYLDTRTARILIEQSNATATVVQIPLFDGDWSTGGGLEDADLNNMYAYGIQTQYSADYAYGGLLGTSSSHYIRIIKKVDANWDTVNKWVFEVIGGNDSGWLPSTLYCALFNKTTGLMVAGSELVFTGGAPTRKTVEIELDAANFTNGDDFEVRIKVGSVGDLGYLYRAALYAYVSPVTKAEIHYRCGSCISATGAEDDARYLYEPTKLPSSTPFHFEASGFLGAGTPPDRFVMNCGTEDVGSSYIGFSTPSTVVITSGAWNNENNILTFYDQNCATLILNAAGQSGVLTISNFSPFVPAPPAEAGILDYKTIAMFGLSPDGQVAEIGGGTTSTERHSVTGQVVDFIVIEYRYDFFGNATGPVTARCYQLNATPSTFYWDGIELQVRWGSPVNPSALDYTVARDRFQSGNIQSSLTPNNRYASFVGLDGASLFHSSGFLVAKVGG